MEEAKRFLGELVSNVSRGREPVTITRRATERAVLMSYEEYKKLQALAGATAERVAQSLAKILPFGIRARQDQFPASIQNLLVFPFCKQNEEGSQFPESACSNFLHVLPELYHLVSRGVDRPAVKVTAYSSGSRR
ncbi:MAG: type II toxin-antitoxin system Phd/YefM family antitoxin [Clostridia bacterium]|nr:MAG: type II toxin-antitoxin system Phd/YefM family antitoxin [Clostridia bacterium]